jgi:very-short-patch-repair endonuclease
MSQKAPFPLEGGRVGDGGGAGESRNGRPKATAGGVALARRLRREQTVAERLLWKQLRLLRMNFRRQTPIGRYVVDFSHRASRLIIEIDGPVHDFPGRVDKDAARQAWLEAEGFRVLRFAERDVRSRLLEVVQRIVAEAAPPPSPALPPSRGKGERP